MYADETGETMYTQLLAQNKKQFIVLYDATQNVLAVQIPPADQKKIEARFGGNNLAGRKLPARGAGPPPSPEPEPAPAPKKGLDLFRKDVRKIMMMNTLKLPPKGALLEPEPEPEMEVAPELEAEPEVPIFNI